MDSLIPKLNKKKIFEFFLENKNKQIAQDTDFLQNEYYYGVLMTYEIIF